MYFGKAIMRRSAIVAIAVVIVVVLVSSLFFLVEVSERPHIAFIPESTAERISGQNYTLSSLTTSTGSGLPYAFDGNKMVQGVLYTNVTLIDSNGTPVYYYFQDYVMEFNTTKMAQVVYLLNPSTLEYINNSTYNGFHFTYTTVSQKRYGPEYFWGAVGYSGNLVFVIMGQSFFSPKINMETVAIDQINAMTALQF